MARLPADLAGLRLFCSALGIAGASVVTRLIQDRYFAYDDRQACDLATGEQVRLDDLASVADQTPSAPCGIPALAPLIEVLDDARDGGPRWVVADARNGVQAAAMARRAACDARRRGFVPILVPLFLRWRDALADDLQERTLLLIGSFVREVATARTALLQAACSSPRPHVLLTFQTATAGAAPHIVREARAAYRPLPVERTPPPSA